MTTILEHSADDVSAATGCPRCALLRDPLSGWGRLDIAKAVALRWPARCRHRTATRRTTTPARRPTRSGASSVKLTASVDYYEDPVDVYRVALAAARAR